MIKSLTLKRVGDFFNGEYEISIWLPRNRLLLY